MSHTDTNTATRGGTQEEQIQFRRAALQSNHRTTCRNILLTHTPLGLEEPFFQIIEFNWQSSC